MLPIRNSTCTHQARGALGGVDLDNGLFFCCRGLDVCPSPGPCADASPCPCAEPSPGPCASEGLRRECMVCSNVSEAVSKSSSSY